MEFQKIWYFWICLWVFYLKNLTLDLEIENWKFFRGDEKKVILNLHVFAGSPKIALLSIRNEKFFFPSAFPLFLLTFLWRFQIWPWFLSIYSSFWEILFHDFSWFLNQNGYFFFFFFCLFWPPILMEFQKFWYFWIELWVFYTKNLTLDLKNGN